jgi:hypothetical protein
MPSSVRGLKDPSERTAGRLREMRFVVPDARDPDVRRQVMDAVSRLDPADEEAAMRWIEAVTADEDWDSPDRDAAG